MLLFEAGGKTASKLQNTQVLYNVDSIISYISHWHPDHYKDIVKISGLCKSHCMPLTFLDYPDINDSNAFYKNLKDFGVSQPEMVSRGQVEMLMGLRSLSFEKLRHNLINSMALIMEQNGMGQRNIKKFVPDNNEVNKARSLFAGDLDQLDMLYFDVTNPSEKATIFPLIQLRTLKFRMTCVIVLLLGIIPQKTRRHF